MTPPNNKNAILEIVRACDDVVLATYDGEFPDLRHLTNAMNRDTHDFPLFFMTGRGTQKYGQIAQNNKCALYYFDAKTRHAVRIYGEMSPVDDIDVRRAMWRDEYSKFGYDGPDGNTFVLLRFDATKYKYYISDDMITGMF